MIFNTVTCKYKIEYTHIKSGYVCAHIRVCMCVPAHTRVHARVHTCVREFAIRRSERPVKEIELTQPKLVLERKYS